MRGSQSTGSSHTRAQTCRLGHRQAFVPAVLWLPLLLLSASDVWASYSSPLTSTPVGSPTAPPSSYEGGLVTNPNPMDSSSNSVITGNVRGGKHFRGPIPYDAPTSFQAPLGSTRLDSFLRYSAVPDELGGYAPGYDTFYSPTGTASKIRPGQGGVFAPTSPRVAGGISQWRPDQPADVVDLGDTRQSRVSVGETASTAGGSLDTWRRFGNWPLSRSPEQMRQVISDELGRQFTDDLASQQNNQPITPEEYRLQMEQFRQQLEKVKADASKLEQSLRVGDALPKDASQQAPSDPAEAARLRTTIEGLTTPLPQAGIERRSGSDLLLKPAPLAPDISALTGQAQAPGAADIASIIAPRGLAPVPGAKGIATSESRLPVSSSQSNAGGLVPDAATRTERVAELFLPRGQGGAGQTQAGSAGDLPALQRIKETAGAMEKPSGSSIYKPMNAMSEARSAPDRVAALMESLPATSNEMDSQGSVDANTPGTGELKPSEQLAGDQVRQRRETLTSSSMERFDRYLKAAEMYLQQGRYYRAVESFSLASLYSPNDRRVYLGRSHALFAAGEYVSSATFLAKAIELDPNQTLAKLDLVNATGGPDLFLRRITDLEQCARTTGTPDLQFLLAYTYYQMDRPEEAKTAIEAAEKGLPHLSAVSLLRAAIGK
jgi:tetratricopeptide (TPR) repeat protein